jgi:hypothetical protein
MLAYSNGKIFQVPQIMWFQWKSNIL